MPIINGLNKLHFFRHLIQEIMKNINIHVWILCMLVLPLLTQVRAQNINIQAGGSIKVTGATSIVIKDGGLVNNGTYTKGTELLTFSGTTAATLSGSSNTDLYNVAVSNTGGITTQIGLLTTNNLTIASGSSFTIDPSKAVTVNGTLTNNAGNTGLVISSTTTGTASLLNSTAGIPATIHRYVTGSGTPTAMMYHMVSVPLIPASSSTSNLFLDSYLFDFTENSNTWNALGSSTTTPLDETRGYMTYYPLGVSTTYTFAGLINSGSFTPLTTGSVADNTHGWNLVPNPYPSAIDWNAADGWVKTAIDGSIYFWPAGMPASSSNYSTWNGTEGTGTPAGTRYIPAGQSFFVHATTASPVLTMDNGVRVHNAQAFYKATDLIPNLFRLHAAAKDANDDIIVHFRDGATSGFDGEFDAYKLQGGADAPQLSSLASDGFSLSINSLPLGSGDAVVPLNFSFSSATDVTFTAEGMESFLAGSSIFLEDITLSKIVDLQQNPVYTFSYIAGSTPDRFRLRFTVFTGITEHNSVIQGTAFVSNGYLYADVPAMDGQKAEVVLFNALGQKINTHSKTLAGITQISDSPYISGVYILRMISGKQVFTTKIVNK